MLWLFMFFLQCVLFYQAMFGETPRHTSESNVVLALTTPMSVNGTMTQAGRRLQGTGPGEPWVYPNPAEEEMNENLNQDQIEMMQQMTQRMMATFVPLVIVGSVLSCASCISQIVFMVSYKGSVHDQRPQLIPTGAISAPHPSLADPLERFPLFGCFDDFDTCAHGCFCNMCRVGDTWGTAKVMEYYMSIIAHVCMQLLAGMVPPVLSVFEHLISSELPTKMSFFNSLAGLAAQGAAFGFFRNKLREKLGGVRGDTQKMCMDGVIWAFCASCATIQEARVVDNLNGVHVACCCKLTRTRQTEEYDRLVGPPSVVTGMVVQGNQK